MLEQDKNFINILQEIAEATNANLEEKDFFKIALEKCLQFSHSDKGSIISVDQERKVLKIIYQIGLGKKVEDEIFLKIGQGVTGLVAKTKKPILINDVENSTDYVNINSEVKSECAVPILYKNQLLGIISVDSSNKNNYDEKTLELLKSVSGFLGQALNNLQYQKSLQEKIKNDEILFKINQILSSSLKTEEALIETLEEIKKMNRFKRGALILPDLQDNHLEIKKFFGYSEKQALRGKYMLDEGIVGKVFYNKKAIYLKNFKENKNFLDKTKSRKQDDFALSIFCLPLMIKNASVGILLFDRFYESNKIFESDIKFLDLLGTQISQQLEIHFLAEKEKNRLIKENEYLKEFFVEKTQFSNIIGKSSKIKIVFEKIKSISATDSTALILGESGTGKELVASAIHFNSNRKDQPFITVNCAAIPESLIESELFGHLKGAFTGAIQNKSGKFKLADKGTLFLDEIGELPLSMQAKLLRVLQEGTIDPVGGDKSEKVNVRIVAATNKDLRKEIKEKNFREDLYYRLSILPIDIPPLRERKEDINLLVQHFIEHFKGSLSKDLIFDFWIT